MLLHVVSSTVVSYYSDVIYLPCHSVL